jgi:hypothetical protein
MMRFEELKAAATTFDQRRVSEAFEEILTEQPSWQRDRATLLITELLSGRPDVPAANERLTIRVFADVETLRVEIHDGGGGAVLRKIRHALDPSAGGWDPHLMNRVADRWGLVSDAEGAWVWFELSLSGEHR